MEGQHRGVRVLLVEDSPAVTRPLVAILQDAGYETAVFHAGTPALEHICKMKPSIALIDIHLPDISGLDLSQRIRETCGEALPIIILSGDNSIDTLRSLPSVGATYFFSKPVNIVTLLAKMEEWLSASESE